MEASISPLGISSGLTQAFTLPHSSLVPLHISFITLPLLSAAVISASVISSIPFLSTISGVISASISTFKRAVILAAASYPSMSIAESASINPIFLPLRIISSYGAPLANSSRIKLVVLFNIPETSVTFAICRVFSTRLNTGVPSITVVS